MPSFERDASVAGPSIQGFASGGFLVDGAVYRGLLLTPQSAHEWIAPALAELAASDLDTLLALDPSPEFVLLGTGTKLALPPRALIVALEDRGIGIEAMDSRAAARTWGLLRGEGRWIAAALMPLG